MIKVAVNKVEGRDNCPPAAAVVLEISGNRVVGIHDLKHEEPFTMWRGGTAVLSEDRNGNTTAAIDGQIVDEFHYPL